MPHRTHTKRPSPARARLLAAATLLSVVLAATGCGDSSSPSVAHLSSTEGSDGGASSAGGGSPPASTASPQQAALAFAQCMRASGVPTFPDPNAGGGFLFRTRTGIDPASPAFKAAQAKCHKFMPSGGGPPSTTNPSPQTLARFLKVARCMRKQGVYDFPDPRTSVPSDPFGSGGGVISDIEEVILVFPSTIDQQSPTFTRAAAACAFPLHNH